MAETLLQIKNLGLKFSARDNAPAILHDVEFSVQAGQTVALVGESGSGKFWEVFFLHRTDI